MEGLGLLSGAEFYQTTLLVVMTFFEVIEMRALKVTVITYIQIWTHQTLATNPQDAVFANITNAVSIVATDRPVKTQQGMYELRIRSSHPFEGTD